MNRIVAAVLVLSLAGCASTRLEQVTSPVEKPKTNEAKGDAPMRLGNFSVSLSVKDIAASRAFYEKLGFKKIMGEEKQSWLILQNETATIGLFHGAFERNTLTFNPGWDRTATTLADFDDVRAIQKMLEAKGLSPSLRADESSTGPASLMLIDPDGNPILLDQHVPAPKKK
jgi:catechol 2,3-dioxygenase-like lactoylglutathione lyase family enzyme